MSKTSFYRIPVKGRKVHAPRRRRLPKDMARLGVGGALQPGRKEREKPVRRTALGRMPELK